MTTIKRAILPLLIIVALTGCQALGEIKPDVTIDQTPDRTEVTNTTVNAAKRGIITAKFNPVEYLLFSQIESSARQARAYCERPKEVKHRMMVIEDITEVLVTHATYLPHNKETAEIARILRKNIGELIARYEKEGAREAVPSTRYCQRKLDLYIAGIRRALEAVGNKVRR